MSVISAFFLLLPAIASVAASAGKAPLYSYGDDKFPNLGEVNDLSRDSRGFLWCAGTRGTAFYNGREFRRLSVSDGLLDNYCYTARESPGGRIWICTWKGVSIYDPGFRTVETHPVLKGEAIRDVMFFEDGALVAVSDGIRFIRGNGVYPIYLQNKSTGQRILGVVDKLYFDETTNLAWFTLFEHGVMSVDMARLLRLWELKSIKLQHGYERLGDDRLRREQPELFEEDETLEASWLRHSLFVLDDPVFRRELFFDLVKQYRCSAIPEEWGGEKVKGRFRGETLILSQGKLHGIEDSGFTPALEFDSFTGNIDDFSIETGDELFLSSADGLTIISGKDPLVLNRSTGLSSNKIIEWEKDRQGIVWIVTGDGVLHKLASRALRIHDSDSAPKLDGVTKSLHLPNGGGVLLGGSSGLMRYRNGSLDECLFQPPEDDPFIDFTLDSDGNPVIVTEKSLVLLQDEDFITLADDLRTDYDKAAFTLDAEGVLWIVAGWEVMTWDGGTLVRPRIENGEIHFSIHAHTAPDSSIYFGTWRGFYRLENDLLTRFTRGAIFESAVTADGLSLLNEEVFDSPLFEDEVVTCGETGPDSALWFGTFGGGLIRFDGTTFINYTMEDGTCCSKINNSVKTPSGDIFFLGDEGACLITASGLESRPELCEFNAEFFDLAVMENGIRLFATSRGCLIDGEDRAFVCNRNFGLRSNRVTSIEKVGDGNYLLLQDNGFAVLDPDLLFAPDKVRIPLVLESISSGGKYYRPGKRIVLNRGSRSVHLEYALSDFLFEQDNRYSFRLAGLEKDFSPVSSSQEVFYPRLPHGEYRIQVKAWNGNGDMTELDGPVIVLPPFFRETVYFRVLVIAMMVLVISGFFLWKIRRAGQANILLREEVEETGRELEQVKFDIDELRKLIPICSYCKNVRDDTGYWQRVEEYLLGKADLTFTHGICPDCIEKLNSDLHKPDMEK